MKGWRKRILNTLWTSPNSSSITDSGLPERPRLRSLGLSKADFACFRMDRQVEGPEGSLEMFPKPHLSWLLTPLNSLDYAAQT